MNMFGLFKPRHTLRSTVDQLVSGLRAGTVVLRDDTGEPSAVLNQQGGLPLVVAKGEDRSPRSPKPLSSSPIVR